jgi:hypothetical protein
MPTDLLAVGATQRMWKVPKPPALLAVEIEPTTLYTYMYTLTDIHSATEDVESTKAKWSTCGGNRTYNLVYIYIYVHTHIHSTTQNVESNKANCFTSGGNRTHDLVYI